MDSEFETRTINGLILRCKTGETNKLCQWSFFRKTMKLMLVMLAQSVRLRALKMKRLNGLNVRVNAT